MDDFPSDQGDALTITPLPYDEDEQARQHLSRRKFLRRSTLAVGGLVAVAGGSGALRMLYPGLSEQFGDILDLGSKTAFPAATPERLEAGQQGVFYQESARTYIVHLARETNFLLAGSVLENQLVEQLFVRDVDDSYWLALYQRCVHLGTTVAFLDRCMSFKCPSHGAHYNCDGAYLDGPAPRSMDRFPLFFKNDHLFVDTGRIMQTPHPDNDTQRLIAIPQLDCSSAYTLNKRMEALKPLVL